MLNYNALFQSRVTTPPQIELLPMVIKWVAAIAPWFCLRLPSCGPGFESQAHHLYFFQFASLKLYRENNEKRVRDWPIFLIKTMIVKNFFNSLPLYKLFMGSQMLMDPPKLITWLATSNRNALFHGRVYYSYLIHLMGLTPLFLRGGSQCDQILKYKVAQHFPKVSQKVITA